MGREVWRMRTTFGAPLGKTWWGYLLDSVACQSCDGTKRHGESWCAVCEGEGIVWPKVEPPGYRLDSVPSWLDKTFVEPRYGWQMWETTSEGSPISPVCESPEALARWLAENGASAFGRDTASYETWLAMIRRGSAPTAAVVGGVLMSGVEMVADADD